MNKWTIRKIGPRWWRATRETEDGEDTIDAPSFYILCCEMCQ